VKKNIEDIEDIEVVVNGSGAAGIAVTKLLMSMGLKRVILCDTKGAIYEGRDHLNAEKAIMAKLSNLQKKKGLLKEVIAGTDVFIGVSAPNMVTPEMVRTMASDPLIFAMANPVPEIMPGEAKAAGANT
jgi:malate dehydrogenase (oxaloacetate-decarboxylating)